MTKQKKCIERISKVIISNYKICPILPSIRIGQICLESGWLTSELSKEANNCCGIKWASFKTSKKYRYKNSDWAVFDSIEDCIIKQGEYYVSKPHYYGELIGETDFNKAIKALQDSPYCENKDYGDKIVNLIKDYNLTQYDKQVVQEGGDVAMKKIWLDAGHSSVSVGASGNGIKEEEYVLEVVLHLGEILAKNGFEVFYSRKDKYPCGNAKSGSQDLNNRTKSANQQKVDLFVSIHNNSFSSSSANGIETLVYDQNSKEAVEIAKVIQKNLIKDTCMTDRGIKYRKDLAVLKQTSMTALLIELGFISNTEDAKKLKSEGYTLLLANSIAKSICQYLQMNYKEVKTESVYNNAVKKLQQEKIIGTPNAWDKPNVKYIEDVVTKACDKVYGVGNYKDAISKLVENKVINSADIWLNKKYKENHVEAMIIKLANLL